MKSQWKVSSNFINDEKIYQVYRLLDVTDIDHSGNREYLPGVYHSQQKAQMMANRANNHDC